MFIWTIQDAVGVVMICAIVVVFIAYWALRGVAAILRRFNI